MAAQNWSYDLLYYNFAATTQTSGGPTSLTTNDFTFAANQVVPGSKYRFKALGKVTTAASSPGTFTIQALWGGTGGTSLVSSGALSFVASATNIPWQLEILVVCTAIGSLFAQGWFMTTTAVLATPAHAPLPASAPAVTSGLTFSSSEALSFALTLSASTNTWVTNMATLETLGS